MAMLEVLSKMTTTPEFLVRLACGKSVHIYKVVAPCKIIWRIREVVSTITADIHRV